MRCCLIKLLPIIKYTYNKVFDIYIGQSISSLWKAARADPVKLLACEIPASIGAATTVQLGQPLVVFLWARLFLGRRIPTSAEVGVEGEGRGGRR